MIMKSLVRNIHSFAKTITTKNAMIMTSTKPTYIPKVSQYYMTTPLQFHMSTAPTLNHKNTLKATYEGPGFYVEQLFTGCLAIYSYYIQSGNQCFLIDPDLDTQLYNDLIASRGKKLVGIFTSHYHADYVSGQYDLAKKHQCKIYMGPKANSSQFVVSTKDKETIQLGSIKFEVWHTPGHTEESSCLLLIDQKGKRNSLFTGDTVFLNEVGRPDLAVKTNLSAADLASMLFDSLQKLKTLEDNIRILPGHGSGSACGKSIGKGDSCNLGTQKEKNYGFKINQKSEFVKLVLAQMPKAPQYFGYNANLNKFEPFFFEEASKKVHKHLTPQQVLEYSKQPDVIIIDVRGTAALKEGIVENSLCIGFDGGFANWVGSLLNPKSKIVLLGTEQQAKESIARLLRIGYINILGHANFPISEWKAKGYPVVNPTFVDQIQQSDAVILDVRKPGEWKQHGVIEGSLKMQLSELFKNPEKLDKSKTYVAHCQSGYRARIAYSYLVSQGYKIKAYPYPFQSIFKSGSVKKVQA